jgi:hypothetical protein
MSALGHKRTLRNVGSMSALPPKADTPSAISMSALCQKQTVVPSSFAELSVELIVQPDAHDVVGEMATEKPKQVGSTTPGSM